MHVMEEACQGTEQGAPHQPPEIDPAGASQASLPTLAKECGLPYQPPCPTPIS